jgi:hypothetical protein
MRLLRVREVENLYGIPIPTLHTWNCRNRFPGLFAKIGGLLFLDEEKLKEIAREYTRQREQEDALKVRDGG